MTDVTPDTTPEATPERQTAIRLKQYHPDVMKLVPRLTVRQRFIFDYNSYMPNPEMGLAEAKTPLDVIMYEKTLIEAQMAFPEELLNDDIPAGVEGQELEYYFELVDPDTNFVWTEYYYLDNPAEVVKRNGIPHPSSPEYMQSFLPPVKLTKAAQDLMREALQGDNKLTVLPDEGRYASTAVYDQYGRYADDEPVPSDKNANLLPEEIEAKKDDLTEQE